MPHALPKDSDFFYQPTAIARQKWLHHFHVWSPKLGRLLSLYSRRAVEFWAMLEAHPEIVTFCEYPGVVLVEQRRRIADFVLRKTSGDEFVVLEGNALRRLDDDNGSLLDPLPIRAISATVMQAHRGWTTNWLQMLPYITSNARFLTPAFINQVEAGLSSPTPLVAIERDHLPTDPMLTRTGVFELARQGRVESRDLAFHPLSPRTNFVRSEIISS